MKSRRAESGVRRQPFASAAPSSLPPNLLGLGFRVSAINRTGGLLIGHIHVKQHGGSRSRSVLLSSQLQNSKRNA